MQLRQQILLNLRKQLQSQQEPDKYTGDFELTPSLLSSFNEQFLRETAILILLKIIDEKLFVVLTKRAEHMNRHPGAWCFPGGETDDTDSNKTHTALRETREEIGILDDEISVIGALSDYHVRTGFNTTPIIGLARDNIHYKRNSNEVSEIIEIPVQHVGNLDNYKTYKTTFEDKSIYLYKISYRNKNILGSTAGMLRKFAQQIKPYI